MSERVAGRLRAWGVEPVFGTPGRDVDALIDALGGDPGFVQTRNEESAAPMACAHAQRTGDAGCRLAPPGAGALRLLGVLHDPVLDRQPAVALAGRPPAGR
ncbi:thiamine pyrophosphate-binding protein [Streptomyces sediminimaris]|uniref:thiamine pyrophosphate-binding protein n=1 Tax=Streptomyces sediminimaris TaxID=3383721 RepID=UPI00399AF91F